MSELERRWDDAVETAWRGFRQRLADRLAEMVEDDVLIVALEREAEAGAAPYCQAAAGPDALRVEAVSNVYLSPELELDGLQEALLQDLGFAEPEAEDWQEGPTNYWIDLGQREADLVAVMVVRALREVYGVVHPIYLSADGLEPQAERQLKPIPPRPRPDVPVHPDGPDDIRRAIDLAVRNLLSEKPEWDDDGCLPLPTQRTWVWVIVSEASPRILLNAPLADDVVDDSRALVEVNLLNQREYGLTFSLRDGRITVTRELDVAVLIPAQVRLEIERLTSQVDGWANDLVTRVGGRRMDEQAVAQPVGASRTDRPTSGRFATAYAVMVELERGQRGSVDPAAMARIFENDTGLLLKAIRINEQRRREVRAKAREARERGRAHAERAARARHEYLRELTARMPPGCDSSWTRPSARSSSTSRRCSTRTRPGQVGDRNRPPGRSR